MFEDYDLSQFSDPTPFYTEAYDAPPIADWHDFSGGLSAAEWQAPQEMPFSVPGGDYEGAQYQQQQAQPYTIGQNSGAVPGGPEDHMLRTPGALAAIGANMGLTNKNGEINWKDPKVLDQWLKLGLGGAQVLNAIFGRQKPRGYADPAALRAQLAGPNNNFTDAQRSWGAGFYGSPINVSRQRIYADQMRSPLAAARGYAEGGEVMMPPEMLGDMGGGPAMDTSGLGPTLGGEAYLQGGHAGGQDDVIDIKAAPGEYIFDADTVSALGDGNNERGAALLDAMRMRIREHKRAAPSDEIPPPALPPLAYLTGENNG